MQIAVLPGSICSVSDRTWPSCLCIKKTNCWRVDRIVNISETMVANYSLFSMPVAFVTAYYPSVLRVSTYLVNFKPNFWPWCQLYAVLTTIGFDKFSLDIRGSTCSWQTYAVLQLTPAGEYGPSQKCSWCGSRGQRTHRTYVLCALGVYNMRVREFGYGWLNFGLEEWIRDFSSLGIDYCECMRGSEIQLWPDVIFSSLPPILPDSMQNCLTALLLFCMLLVC